MAVDVTTSSSITESWYYYLFSALAFLMYFLRRRMRINRR